jgi:hypothetical protein
MIAWLSRAALRLLSEPVTRTCHKLARLHGMELGEPVESGVKASEFAAPVAAASAEVVEPTNEEPTPDATVAGQKAPGQVEFSELPSLRSHRRRPRRFSRNLQPA